jgi:hypothetical protein
VKKAEVAGATSLLLVAAAIVFLLAGPVFKPAGSAAPLAAPVPRLEVRVA